MSDLVEQTRQYLNETPDGLETEFLNEMISLRTGAIVMGLAKTKGYASKVDQEVNKLRRDASDLRKSAPEELLDGVCEGIFP